MDEDDITNKINKIINNSTSIDSINTEKVYKVVEILDRNKNCQRGAISLLIDGMRNSPPKAFIYIQLLQMFISMSTNDWALKELCLERHQTDLVRVLENDNSKVFRDDLLKFIQEIAIEHEQNEKYRLIYSFYKNLKRKGFEFHHVENSNRRQNLDSASNEAVDADIQRAIQLSLKESNPAKKEVQKAQVIPLQKKMKPFPARVLYDFQAEEAGEISIKAGQIINVIEQSNQSWWKGELNGMIGEFPSNFVTVLSNTHVLPSVVTPSVDTEYVEECLKRLLSANPIHPEMDENELLNMENACRNMKSQVTEILNDLEKKNRKYEEIDEKFKQAIAAYQRIVANDLPRRVEPVGQYYQNIESNPSYTITQPANYPPYASVETPHQSIEPPRYYSSNMAPQTQEQLPNYMYESIYHRQTQPKPESSQYPPHS